MLISNEELERMYSQAHYGVYYTTVDRLSDEEVKNYQSMGLKVSIPKEYDCAPWQKVTWRYANVKCDNIFDLDENDSKYSLAQKLWIITKKSRLTNNRFIK